MVRRVFGSAVSSVVALTVAALYPGGRAEAQNAPEPIALDPATVDRARGLLDAAAHGTFDRCELAPQLSAFVSPDFFVNEAALPSALGPPQSMYPYEKRIRAEQTLTHFLVRYRKKILACLVGFGAAALFAGCGGLKPPISVPGSLPQASAIADHLDAAMSWKIYVANASYPTGSVTVYSKHADGNVAPVQTISGSNTGLVQPEGITVDDAGKLYVSDFFGSHGKSDGGPSQQGAVFVFAAKANGNVKPIATIHDGLNYPYGVALDRTGNLYVANFQGCDITVYAARTYKLIRTITSAGSYGLCYIDGIALDGAGNTYVVDTPYSDHDVSSYSGFILVFGPGANGRVLPIRVIAGPLTKLTASYGIAANSRGEIYVTNYAQKPPNPEILVFAAGATGNVKPVRSIRGPMTQLFGTGIALNSRGTIFIANDPFSGTGSITAYRRRARGDVAPIREVSGNNTGLDMPSAVAIGP